MGANDAREMLAAAQAECVRLERELAEALQRIGRGERQLTAARAEALRWERQCATQALGGSSGSLHVCEWQPGAPGSHVLWCRCGKSRWATEADEAKK
jgi:hypothetical protein